MRLSTARDGIAKFLEVQDETPSSTEPVKSIPPRGALTYHYGQGRGGQWPDKDRTLLWLLAFSDTHDPGYDRLAGLEANGELYPDLDPDWTPAIGTLLPWEEHADEDGYEWARLIYGALCTFEINKAELQAGNRVTHPGPTHLTLQKDDDDIWTLEVRRRLGYLPPESQRGRWLTNGELMDLAIHISDTAEDASWIEFDNPPHPTEPFMFVLAHFFDGPARPADWLQRVTDAAIRGHDLPLLLS